MPRISVCIPTYNRKQFLKEALKSLRDQTFQDFETIVLDDGSQDGTGQMIQEEGFGVQYIRQENQGEAKTTNRLIELARCEYISFLHSDDLLLPDALDRLIEARDAQQEDVVVYGNYLKIDEHGTVHGQSKRKLYSGHITAELFNDIIVHPVGSLFPKKALQEVGGLDVSLKACYDYKMELLISRKYRFIALDQPTFKRRRHTSNNSMESISNRIAEYEVLKDFYYNLGGNEQVPRNIAMKRLAKEAYRVGKIAYLDGKRDQASLYLKESMATRFSLKACARFVQTSF